MLEWGKNLSSFSPRISAAGMAGLQVIRDYNQELAQTILAPRWRPTSTSTTWWKSSAAPRLTCSARWSGRESLQHSVKNPFDACQLASSLLADLLEGMYEGSGSCVGIPDLTAGRYLTIQGIGRRFSGTYRARKVTHRLERQRLHAPTSRSPSAATPA